MNELVQIQQQIYLVNGERVMFDDDLAKLYGVETAQLKRAVKRNIERFPSDFMFVVKNADIQHLKSQLGTTKRGGSRYDAFAFTELGVAMLSSVLNSQAAIDININIMRAFVELRRLTQLAATSYQTLQREIDEVKDYIEDILRDQNDINEEHSAQLEAIGMALTELQMQKRKEKPIRPIGFNAPQYNEDNKE
jgi:hypothetical protein